MEFSLSTIFDMRSIILNIEGKTKEEVFIGLIDAMAAAHPECNRDAILSAIQEREAKMNTGIASGIAIPHAVCQGVDQMIGAIGISPSGIEYDALDQKPVHIVFMLAMSEQARENHLRILNQIFTLAQSEALARIRKAQNAEDVHAILSRFH